MPNANRGFRNSCFVTRPSSRRFAVLATWPLRRAALFSSVFLGLRLGGEVFVCFVCFACFFFLFFSPPGGGVTRGVVFFEFTGKWSASSAQTGVWLVRVSLRVMRVPTTGGGFLLASLQSHPPKGVPGFPYLRACAFCPQERLRSTSDVGGHIEFNGGHLSKSCFLQTASVLSPWCHFGAYHRICRCQGCRGLGMKERPFHAKRGDCPFPECGRVSMTKTTAIRLDPIQATVFSAISIGKVTQGGRFQTHRMATHDQ